MECEENVRLMLRGLKSAVWSHGGHVLGKQQHNKFAQSAHARRTAHASSIDENKGFIIKSKATSAPPRAGTTGISFLFII